MDNKWEDIAKALLTTKKRKKKPMPIYIMNGKEFMDMYLPDYLAEITKGTFNSKKLENKYIWQEVNNGNDRA